MLGVGHVLMTDGLLSDELPAEAETPDLRARKDHSRYQNDCSLNDLLAAGSHNFQGFADLLDVQSAGSSTASLLTGPTSGEEREGVACRHHQTPERHRKRGKIRRQGDRSAGAAMVVTTHHAIQTCLTKLTL